MSFRFSVAAVFGIMAVLGVASAQTQEKAKDVPAEKKADTPKADTPKEAPKLEKATFGGGCFWCLEAFFERINGVKSVTSGYAGGEDNTLRPTYEMVCTGQTGHAEVVQIEYDPAVVSFDDLLDIFWLCHNPTTLNEQGPDHGTQYRSIILFHDEGQRQAALKSYQKATSAHLYADPIVTQLFPLVRFFPAEKYHQDYYRKNPRAAYCSMVITPKLRELQMKLKVKAAAKAAEKAAETPK